jgi:hypothetical protein
VREGIGWPGLPTSYLGCQSFEQCAYRVELKWLSAGDSQEVAAQDKARHATAERLRQVRCVHMKTSSQVACARPDESSALTTRLECYSASCCVNRRCKARAKYASEGLGWGVGVGGRGHVPALPRPDCGVCLPLGFGDKEAAGTCHEGEGCRSLKAMHQGRITSMTEHSSSTPCGKCGFARSTGCGGGRNRMCAGVGVRMRECLLMRVAVGGTNKRE